MTSESRAVRPKDSLFPKFALDYFEQLRQQYELLLEETNGKCPASVDAVLKNVHDDPEHTTWAEVFLLETACLYALPDDRLLSEVIRFRNRYREVAGHEAYINYLQCVPLDASKLSVPELRAELLTLAERIRYLYTFVPPRELIRNKLAMRAAWLTVTLAFVFVAAAIFVNQHLHFVPTILVVIFAGMLGGFLSVQQRLQASDDIDPLFKELQLKAGWFSVVVLAPFSGAVFAVVLYWLFLAALLSGGLFPTFATLPDGAAGFNLGDFLWRGSPNGPSDFGKLMAWAFIAGFAERFVPDVLTRMTSQVEVAGRKVPPAATARVAAARQQQQAWSTEACPLRSTLEGTGMLSRGRLRYVVIPLTMLATGFALGRLGIPSAGAAASMGAMPMHAATSTVDRELQAAMNRMMIASATGKRTGDADHDFLVLMIPHHQAAVSMARIELRRGKRADVRNLAVQIIDAQQNEVLTMRRWLESWQH